MFQTSLGGRDFQMQRAVPVAPTTSSDIETLNPLCPIATHGCPRLSRPGRHGGWKSAYLLLTRGEAGMDGSPPERDRRRCRTTRSRSQARGRSDVAEVEFLDHPDGVLEYNLGLRRDIARVIRAAGKPDAVVAGSWDVESRHRAEPGRSPGGRASPRWIALRDAGQPVGLPRVARTGAWSRIRCGGCSWAGTPRPTHGVNVTGEPVERGIASLEAHAQYLAGIPGHPPPRLLITGITRLQGRAMGVPNAVLFRAWDFHAPPPIAAEAMRRHRTADPWAPAGALSRSEHALR